MNLSAQNLKRISYLWAIPFVAASIIYLKVEGISPFRSGDKEIKVHLSKFDLETPKANDLLLDYSFSPDNTKYHEVIRFIDSTLIIDTTRRYITLYAPDDTDDKTDSLENNDFQLINANLAKLYLKLAAAHKLGKANDSTEITNSEYLQFVEALMADTVSVLGEEIITTVYPDTTVWLGFYYSDYHTVDKNYRLSKDINKRLKTLDILKRIKSDTINKPISNASSKNLEDINKSSRNVDDKIKDLEFLKAKTQSEIDSLKKTKVENLKTNGKKKRNKKNVSFEIEKIDINEFYQNKITPHWPRQLTINELSVLELNIEKVNKEGLEPFRNMNAKLSGIGFEILSVEKESQDIHNVKKIHWRWQVIPRAEEAQMLNLLVSTDDKFPEPTSRNPIELIPLNYSYTHELKVIVPLSDQIAGFFQTYEVPISLVGGSLSFISIWNWIVGALSRRKRMQAD